MVRRGIRRRPTTAADVCCRGMLLQVHEIVQHAVEADEFQGWSPTLIICIAAGG